MMKMFKASSVLATLKVVSVFGALTFLGAPAAIAQNATGDQDFLNDLYAFLQSQDRSSSELAHHMGDELNIIFANGACAMLANGESPQAVYDEFVDGLMDGGSEPNAYAQEEYSSGLYIGSIMNLGSAYYCPQYQPQVVQALQLI